MQETSFTFSETILCLFQYWISELPVNQFRLNCLCVLSISHAALASWSQPSLSGQPPTLPLYEGGNPLRAFHWSIWGRGQLPPPSGAASLPLGDISLLYHVLSCVYVTRTTGRAQQYFPLQMGSAGTIWSKLYTNWWVIPKGLSISYYKSQGKDPN